MHFHMYSMCRSESTCTFTCIGYVDLLSIYKRKLKQINENKNKLITYGSGHVHHPISIFFHTYFQHKNIGWRGFCYVTYHLIFVILGREKVQWSEKVLHELSLSVSLAVNVNPPPIIIYVLFSSISAHQMTKSTPSPDMFSLINYM